MGEGEGGGDVILSKYARIPPSSAGGMNGLPSPLGGEGKIGSPFLPHDRPTLSPGGRGLG
jgi:hypothetical protein